MFRRLPVSAGMFPWNVGAWRSRLLSRRLTCCRTRPTWTWSNAERCSRPTGV